MYLPVVMETVEVRITVQPVEMAVQMEVTTQPEILPQKWTQNRIPNPSMNPDTSGSTKAVNSKTKLKDGVYKPDKFSWSGGSGRVNITCDKVTIKKWTGTGYNCIQQFRLSVCKSKWKYLLYVKKRRNSDSYNPSCIKSE